MLVKATESDTLRTAAYEQTFEHEQPFTSPPAAITSRHPVQWNTGGWKCSHKNTYLASLITVTGAGVAQSVQCLTTGWTTGWSGFDPRRGQRIFPLTSVTRPALGSTQPPVQWGTGGSFAGVKARPGRDADHSPPSSVEVENEELYLLSPQAPPWRVPGLLYLFYHYSHTAEKNIFWTVSRPSIINKETSIILTWSFRYFSVKRVH
jgi:hypothetical protein